MTRRDRATMSLALECLRDKDRYVGDAIGILGEYGGDACEALGAATIWTSMVSDRLMRARLALALRVLLRVDAGGGHEWGGTHECWAEVSGSEMCMHPESNGWAWAPYQGWRRPLRVRPLWESAPAHEASR